MWRCGLGAMFMRRWRRGCIGWGMGTRCSGGAAAGDRFAGAYGRADRGGAGLRVELSRRGLRLGRYCADCLGLGRAGEWWRRFRSGSAAESPRRATICSLFAMLTLAAAGCRLHECVAPAATPNELMMRAEDYAAAEAEPGREIYRVVWVKARML